MTPSQFGAIVRNVALTIVALGAVAFAAIAWPAHAQLADPAASAPSNQITYGTACGAPGVGRLIGQVEPVARSASDAAGTYVNSDGYWATPCPLVATPGTACGAPGIGYSDVTHGMLARQHPNAAAGWRVDAGGRWTECDRPCLPAQSEAFRTWSQGPHTCTTYNRYDSDGRSTARDRVLRHGELGRWEQWLGGMRGTLHERCEDGVRTRTLAACAPATHCDTRIEATRTGVAYAYDARPASARVPVGSSVDLRAADGSTWPATCAAGSWDVPSVRPAPPRPAPPQRAITTCRAQTSQYDVPDLGRRWISVRQLSTPVGDQAVGETAGTPMRRTIPMLCGADGRFTVAPREQPPSTAEAGAAEWQRLYDLQRGAR